MSKKGGEPPKAKAEKPVPANDKKPVTQKEGSNPSRDNNNQPRAGGNQKENKGAFNKAPVQNQQQPPQQQQSWNRPVSEDPEEAAIQKRIDKVYDDIKSCRNQLEGIKRTLDDKRKQRDDLIKEHKQYTDQIRSASEKNKELYNEKGKTIEKLQYLRSLKRQKVEHSNTLKARLPNPPSGDSDEADEKYLRKIEEDLKHMEQQYSTNTHGSLNEEKKYVAELGKLQAAKRLYQEYKAVREAIKGDDAAIKELESELDKSKGSSDDARSQSGALKTKRDETGATITQTKDQEAEIAANRESIREKINTLQDELVKEKTTLEEHRQKKREEFREKRAAEREQREAEREKERQRRAELYEKKKERENERKKLELLEIPYQDEIDLCDKLEKYMETLLPKKTESAASAPAPAASSITPTNFADTPEGTFIKKEENPVAAKKKGKKQKAVKISQDLKHNVEVFLQFEKLSLAPPSKVSDVENAIFEIHARKEHFSKLSASKMGERAEVAKAQNGNSKEKEEEKENATTTTSKSLTEDGDGEQLQDEGVAPEEDIIPEVDEV